ncbi:hypothetical protein CYMTET_17347 [Cymbomonas tetramitiformis]|uniref:Cyclic nucleotide-binding domain-containing protein n=1 Tax=Cymbomonas tetramitiformis TaxID=36881 RepID=A0AAE0GAI3_9CHLO|nr:hypothetical protein CYMTET_17347 [Cymbomonas tetramitiformis]
MQKMADGKTHFQRRVSRALNFKSSLVEEVSEFCPTVVAPAQKNFSKLVKRCKESLKTRVGERSRKDLVSIMTFMANMFAEYNLSDAQKIDLCQAVTYEEFDNREYIFHKGDIGDKYFMILYGRVGFYAPNPNPPPPTKMVVDLALEKPKNALDMVANYQKVKQVEEENQRLLDATLKKQEREHKRRQAALEKAKRETKTFNARSSFTRLSRDASRMERTVSMIKKSASSGAENVGFSNETQGRSLGAGLIDLEGESGEIDESYEDTQKPHILRSATLGRNSFVRKLSVPLLPSLYLSSAYGLTLVRGSPYKAAIGNLRSRLRGSAYKASIGNLRSRLRDIIKKVLCKIPKATSKA